MIFTQENITVEKTILPITSPWLSYGEVDNDETLETIARAGPG